jgi:hypothetical protein
MRELLIRYLLGELDSQEHDQLHAELRRNPELRSELAHLRACFAANQDENLGADEPPGGLAQRTTERCTSGGDAEYDDEDLRRRAAVVAAATEPPAGVLGWSLADLTVAGGVMLAVSMLLFPALRNSREVTRMRGCEYNMHEFFAAMTSYADNHGGYFPGAQPHEFAMVIPIELVEAGCATREQMKELLWCPAAPLADQVRDGQLTLEIPRRDQYRAMTPAQAAVAAWRTTPFYAFRFGFVEDGKYHLVRDDRSPNSFLLADTCGDQSNNLMSQNHGGDIIQLLCTDGSVKSFTTCTVPGLNDNLYRNARGRVGAGWGRHDAVLGRPDAKPDLAGLPVSR